MEKLEKVQSRNTSTNGGGNNFVSGSLMNARQSVM